MGRASAPPARALARPMPARPPGPGRAPWGPPRVRPPRTHPESDPAETGGTVTGKAARGRGPGGRAMGRGNCSGEERKKERKKERERETELLNGTPPSHRQGESRSKVPFLSLSLSFFLSFFLRRNSSPFPSLSPPVPAPSPSNILCCLHKASK